LLLATLYIEKEFKKIKSKKRTEPVDNPKTQAFSLKIVIKVRLTLYLSTDTHTQNHLRTEKNIKKPVDKSQK
jgi:hypothetical protein